MRRDRNDLLNVALFGLAARQWWDETPSKDGNIRDYACVQPMIVRSNLESLNANESGLRQLFSGTFSAIPVSRIAIRRHRVRFGQASTNSKTRTLIEVLPGAIQ